MSSFCKNIKKILLEAFYVSQETLWQIKRNSIQKYDINLKTKAKMEK